MEESTVVGRLDAGSAVGAMVVEKDGPPGAGVEIPGADLFVVGSAERATAPSQEIGESL